MFDIVMPLFNKERFVSEAIESVLAQTYTGWKLFVVDDGSTDGSVAAVERFTDERISLLRQENAGPGAARNRGITAGRAAWIALLDADDVWLVNHLQVLDRLRARFPAAALIGTGFEYWSGDPRPRSSSSSPGADRIARYFREFADGRRILFSSTAAFGRHAVDKVGLFRPGYSGEDTEFWARLALHGPVAVSSEVTALYRVGTGGLVDIQATGASQAPSRLEEVSLPVAMLMDELPKVADPQLRADILDYVDHDVGVVLMRLLHAGRIDDARRLRSLFVRGPRGKARVAALLVMLPRPFGQQLWRLILALKRWARVLLNKSARS